MDEIESLMLLSHVETWIVELEREVRAFEVAVAEVEEVMDDAEYAEECDETGGQNSHAQDLQQLEHVLEATERVAELVHAADSALSEAIATVYQSIENEASMLGMAEESVAGGAGMAGTSPATTMDDFGAILKSAIPWQRDPDVPLQEGSLILGGRYRLVQILHQRPRLNLYLARRQTVETPGEATNDVSQPIAPTEEQEPLVAIRELVLTGLSPEIRKQIERAAFEEFVSPVVLGSQRLPGAGDRVRLEGERHYLVMQLRRTKGERPAMAVTLAELLLSKRQWPSWLDLETALEWGMQLCRIVARLHRLGAVLGDLDPTTVLVDSEGTAQWAPVLLVSWPPPPQFWPASATGPSAMERYARIFPASHLSANKAFAAPEMLNGVYNQRSDVYSSGALLYLLLTRYAPASAARRMRAEYRNAHTEHKNHHNGSVGQIGAEGMALIPPHLFNSRIPMVLEDVLLRALALDPTERYSTVFELVEALESSEVRQSLSEALTTKDGTGKVSRMGRMVEWLKRELNE